MARAEESLKGRKKHALSSRKLLFILSPFHKLTLSKTMRSTIFNTFDKGRLKHSCSLLIFQFKNERKLGQVNLHRYNRQGKKLVNSWPARRSQKNSGKHFGSSCLFVAQVANATTLLLGPGFSWCSVVRVHGSPLKYAITGDLVTNCFLQQTSLRNQIFGVVVKKCGC